MAEILQNRFDLLIMLYYAHVNGQGQAVTR